MAIVGMLHAGAYARIVFALRAAPRCVIIVGGGPSADHNQVAIESNVRYVSRLLPPDTHRSTLFADGDANSASVLYVDDVKAMPVDQQALSLALQGTDRDFSAYGHYRKPAIPGTLDGASTKRNVGLLIDKIGQDPQLSENGVLLYFTGHGSPLNSNLDNNYYDLWGKSGALSVRDLAEQISHLPPEAPVTIIMAQCYSGAFGNLLFEGGNPANPFVRRDIVGFFATTKDRVAAGCTPALNEAEYHDFTSYFFAALAGQDRLGRKVTGADYNHDGTVGMDEAFCYTLAHDNSIDVPVCTSDVMLRREVPFKVDEIVQTRYSDVKRWASRAQRAALDALSVRLKLTSEDRYAVAYAMMMPKNDASVERNQTQLADTFRRLRSARRAYLFGRWPDLRTPGTKFYQAARTEALSQIDTQIAGGGEWKDLVDAYTASEAAQDAAEDSENRAAAAIRMVRLCTTITLGHQLMQTGNAEQKARLTHLLAAERRPLLDLPRLHEEGTEDASAAAQLP